MITYWVKFGYGPGDWRVESGKIHATRTAAIAEAQDLHTRFSTPEQRTLDWRCVRRFNGVGPYYALRVCVVPKTAPILRRTIATVQILPPVLRKRAEIRL